LVSLRVSEQKVVKKKDGFYVTDVVSETVRTPPASVVLHVIVGLGVVVIVHGYG